MRRLWSAVAHAVKDAAFASLHAVGVLRRPDLRGGYEARHPAPQDLPPGRLVVVRDDSTVKAACFLCPSGCGQKLMLSMSDDKKPRWTVRFDWLGRPTVSPSIRQMGRCRCHYWIQRGKVHWCGDSRHSAR